MVVATVAKAKKSVADAAAAAFWSSMDKLAPGAIAPAGELAMQIPRIKTGVFLLDLATYGGLPIGRIIRPFGEPKVGKTGFCLKVAAEFIANHCGICFLNINDGCVCEGKTRIKPTVLWVDAENRMADMLYWPAAHGVDLEHFRVLAPPTGQHIVDVVDAVLRSSAVAHVGLIIVDSLAHVVSQDELDKATLDGPTVGRNAHLLNSAFRKWVSAIHALGLKNSHKPTIICINQIRQKVGVTYGSNEIMPGGLGQDFATSVDIRFSKGSDCYIVWNEKTGAFEAKEKSFKSKFKPAEEVTPDFTQVNFRITASGICPRGRSGTYNYWLKGTHGHAPGDVDNGLQLWSYAKRYLVEVEGTTKKLAGLEAKTYDELEATFRADKDAQAKVWAALMEKLTTDQPTAPPGGVPVDDVPVNDDSPISVDE